MSIRLKLIIVVVILFALFLATGILVSADILERAVRAGESRHSMSMLDLSMDLIRHVQSGRTVDPDSLRAWETRVLDASADLKQRQVFRDDLLRKLILLLLLNAVPYFIIGYFAVVFVVSRTVNPIEDLTRAIQKYPDIDPDSIKTGTRADREVKQLTEQFQVMLRNIAAYQKKLQERGKLDGWIEMSRAIVHEVGNAMAPAKSKVGELTRELPGNTTVALVWQSIMRMDDIFRHVRQFYKSGTITRSSFDLLDELRFLCDGFAVTLADNTGCRSLTVHAGRTECTQLFINLIKNALEAVGDSRGGQVTVEISLVRDLTVSVCDTGPGMSGDQLNRIFSPGFSNKVGGFGMGLAIVSKYITLHEWTLSVDSQPGHGTRFTVTIPEKDVHETIGAPAR